MDRLVNPVNEVHSYLVDIVGAWNALQRCVLSHCLHILVQGLIKNMVLFRLAKVVLTTTRWIYSVLRDARRSQ